MKPLSPCPLALLLLASRLLMAADDPFGTYCANPTPENAAKVQSAKTPGIDNREFDARLQILEDQVLCSDVEAIRLVYRLMKESDGASSEILSQMLGRLVRINPRLFLGELARHRRQIGDRLPWILCGTGPAYIDRPAAQRYVLRKRLAAIETVDVPALQELRDECVLQLQRSIEKPGDFQQDRTAPGSADSQPGEERPGGNRADEEAAKPTASGAAMKQPPIHRAVQRIPPCPIEGPHNHLPPGDWDREVIEPSPVDRSRSESDLLRGLER